MDLTAEQWLLIQPLLPSVHPHPAGRGRPCRDERAVLNAIFWKLRNTARWQDLPSYYPSQQTCRRRYEEWKASGLFNQILKTLMQHLRDIGGFDLATCLQDGSLTYTLEPGQPLRFIVTTRFKDSWQISTASIVLTPALHRVFNRHHLPANIIYE